MPDWEEHAGAIHAQRIEQDSHDLEEIEAMSVRDSFDDACADSSDDAFPVYPEGRSTHYVSSDTAIQEQAGLALLSKRTLLVGVLLLLGFLGIFMWSWIFEVLGFFSDTAQEKQAAVQPQVSEVLTLPGQASLPLAKTPEPGATPLPIQTLPDQNQASSPDLSPLPDISQAPPNPLPLSSTPAGPSEITDTPTSVATAVTKALQTEAAIEPAQQQGVSLLHRNPEHYTIQIIALQDPEKLKALMSRHAALQDNLFTHTMHRDGKVLHVLTYGDFETKQQATTAMLQLPLELQKNKPWIRLLRDVQGAIRERS